MDITQGFIIGPEGNTFDVEIGECISSPIDCNGDYYGSAAEDSCDECSGGNTGHTDNCDMDCAGICFGDSYQDECGVCDTN